MNAPRRLRRWWLALGGLAVAAILAVLVWNWYAATRFERRVEALRAAGHPVSLADLAGQPIPREQNAAVYLAQAEKGLRAVAQAIRAAEEAADVEAQKAADKRGEPPSEVLSEDEPPEGVRKAIRAALAAHPDVLPLLIQAANCLEYRIDGPTSCIDPTGKEFLDRVGDHREAVRLLVVYANRDLLAQGKRDQAMRNCITALALARHFDREPAMVGFLVAVACRAMAIDSANEALQSGKVPADVRQALDEELARHSAVQSYRQALVTERAFNLDMVKSQFGTNWLGRLMASREGPAVLDEFERFLARADAVAEGPRPATATAPGGIFAGLLVPALEAAEVAARRSEAQLRSLRVLLALQARGEPNSPPPADLAELGLPKPWTLDPFTGKPLRVRRVEGGWLIYSLGPNGQDDGGQFDDDADCGLGPPVETPPADADSD